MQKIRRHRRSEDAWREIVARQAQSGLTVQAFGEREGINAASLYGWRSRLREGAEDERPPERLPKKAKSVTSATEFIELGTLGTITGRFEVKLDLGGGVLLHLVRS